MYNCVEERTEVREPNTNFIWYLKDNNNRFVHKNSIEKEIGNRKNTWICEGYEILTPECRGYITKNAAEDALKTLQDKNNKAGFNLNFHIEYLDQLLLLKERKLF